MAGLLENLLDISKQTLSVCYTSRAYGGDGERAADVKGEDEVLRNLPAF